MEDKFKKGGGSRLAAKRAFKAIRRGEEGRANEKDASGRGRGGGSRRLISVYAEEPHENWPRNAFSGPQGQHSAMPLGGRLNAARSFGSSCARGS